MTWCARLVHPAQQVVPLGPVDVAERQPEPAHDVGVQALGVQHLGDVVDRRRVDGGDDGLLVDVAHQRDLALDARRDRRGRSGRRSRRAGCRCGAARRPSAGSAWSSARRTGRCRAPARRAGRSTLSRPTSWRTWRDGLEERQRLDVADRAADLGDDDVDVGGRAIAPDPGLDLVGDVRDDLDGVAEVLPAPLLGDHRRVDLAGRDVRRAVQVACRGSARSARRRGRSRRRRR